uniref:Uncharacterized protein n=1 Tax=Rhizophora mucronata TaxID=61149 RepID=A0A2P2N3X7_RHIMU
MTSRYNELRSIHEADRMPKILNSR